MVSKSSPIVLLLFSFIMALAALPLHSIQHRSAQGVLDKLLDLPNSISRPEFESDELDASPKTKEHDKKYFKSEKSEESRIQSPQMRNLDHSKNKMKGKKGHLFQSSAANGRSRVEVEYVNGRDCGVS